jgi:hypothetical protein
MVLLEDGASANVKWLGRGRSAQLKRRAMPKMINDALL